MIPLRSSYLNCERDSKESPSDEQPDVHGKAEASGNQPESQPENSDPTRYEDKLDVEKVRDHLNHMNLALTSAVRLWNEAELEAKMQKKESESTPRPDSPDTIRTRDLLAYIKSEQRKKNKDSILPPIERTMANVAKCNLSFLNKGQHDSDLSSRPSESSLIEEIRRKCRRDESPASTSAAYNPPPAAYNPPSAAYNPPSAAYNPPSAAYNPPSAAYNPPSAAYNPPSAAYKPPSAAYKPPSAAYKPPSAAYKPPSAAYKPPSAAYNPPSAAYNPPSAAYNPPSAAYNPPSAAYNPPSAAYNPPSAAYKPPSAAYKPPSAAYNPPSAAYNPPSAAYNPPSAAYKPPSAAYKPPSAAYKPPSAAYKPPSAAYNPPSAAYNPPPTTMQEPGPSHQNPSFNYTFHSSHQKSPGSRSTTSLIRSASQMYLPLAGCSTNDYSLQRYRRDESPDTSSSLSRQPMTRNLPEPIPECGKPEASSGPLMKCGVKSTAKTLRNSREAAMRATEESAKRMQSLVATSPPQPTTQQDDNIATAAVTAASASSARARRERMSFRAPSRVSTRVPNATSSGYNSTTRGTTRNWSANRSSIVCHAADFDVYGSRPTNVRNRLHVPCTSVAIGLETDVPIKIKNKSIVCPITGRIIYKE